MISVLEVAQSTLHEFVDMQMKFCSECESINLDEVRTVSEEEEDRARRGDRNADGKTAGRVEQ